MGVVEEMYGDDSSQKQGSNINGAVNTNLLILYNERYDVLFRVIYKPCL